MLTFPQLIDNYDKIIFETRAKAFYTQINETVRRSYADNEEPYYWIENKNYTYAEVRAWLDKYIFPYMKHFEVIDCANDVLNKDGSISFSEQAVCFRMANGGLAVFGIDVNGADISFFPKGIKERSSRTKLQFQFVKKRSGSTSNIKTRESMNFVEPYTYRWNGTRYGLKDRNSYWGCFEGCGQIAGSNCGYCTKLLQLNGWKIPKDYPW